MSVSTEEVAVPQTCLVDGCAAPLVVTDWSLQTVTTHGEPDETIIQRDAPRRRTARCTHDAEHRFEQFEGSDWQAQTRG